MKKADVNWQMVMMILAIVVLVVLLFIFKDIIFGSKENFESFNTCEGKGGIVKEGNDAKCDPGEMQIYVTKYIKESCNKKDDAQKEINCICCIDQENYFSKKDEK